VVILLISSYALLRVTGVTFISHKTQNLNMREVRTEPGQKARLELSDGSSVILNASSVLRFPEQFQSDERDVELQGEAFFDVAEQHGSRFVIRAGDAVIQVVGTRFDVKAWPDDESIDVAVERGKVLVRSTATARQGVILTEGQMTSVPHGSDPSQPQNALLPLSTAWLHGQLLFDHTPLRDALKQIERKYGLRFSPVDSVLATRHLSATFVQDQSSTDVLKAISVALNVSLRQSGNQITFIPSRLHKKNRP